jgi:Tfp pilus assembly protein PilF
MIGSAVDGAGPLRWIDGWQLLSPEHRADIRTLSPDDARTLARRQRSAFILTGRVIARGPDSATVALELRDVATDESVARQSATAPTADAWRAGLAATTQLLPRLIETGVPDVESEWATRNPTAVAHFLLAESAFRRVQLDTAEAQFVRAVAADSSFGLAAIRGAQAATWNHHHQGASSLIDVALRSRLSPRHEAFARGYRAFLEGRADSAVAQLRHALAMDSSSAFVWMQLGEVYAHLLPVEGNTDSLEADALRRAYRLDSTATNVLFHLIETELRHGDTASAAPLLARFLAAGPDTMLARQLEVMDACVRRGPGGTDWPRHAAAHPLPLLSAAVALGAGGRRTSCAVAGFDAILATDTAATADADARRWYALVGMQGLRLGRGDTAAAAAGVDAFVRRWGAGSSLYLLDAVLMGAFGERAAGVVAADARAFGPDFAGCSSPLRCWLLGLRLTRSGRWREGAALADRIMALPVTVREPQDSLLAGSLRAHTALARGDTAQAIAALRALLGAPRSGAAQEWDILLPMGAERLALAHLMVARGQPERAVALLDVFDSRALGHALFVAASLDLRARAAGGAGDGQRAAAYRTRLSQLQRE